MKNSKNLIYTKNLSSAPGSKQKTAALTTKEYLEERAKRGSRETLLAFLAEAPDVEPEEYDKL